MKIIIDDYAKKTLTLEDMPVVKKMIADFKEDTGLKEYAEMAARCWLNNTEYGKTDFVGGDYFKIYDVKATFCRNRNYWNYYSDESGDIDIWVQATIRTAHAFLEIGVCLSEIWQIGSSEEFNASFPEKCYANYYQRENR